MGLFSIFFVWGGVGPCCGQSVFAFTAFKLRRTRFALWSAAPRVARRAKRGGPGRTRTCNQTVMSGRKSTGFVDFAVFLFAFDRVRCVSTRLFLVRNWCGPRPQPGTTVADLRTMTVGVLVPQKPPRLKALPAGLGDPQRLETFRRFPRTCGYLPTGKYSILNRASPADRLCDQIRRLRDRASRLAPGHERDELLHSAHQDEIALRLIEWVTSSGQLPPPEDMIPIRRHRLHRK